MVNEGKVGWTPDEIVRVTAASELAAESRRRRMEADYGWYLMEWRDSRWEEGGKPEDYHSYISNEPRTFADRMVELLVSADMIARVPYGDLRAEERAFGEAKERFFEWARHEADKSQMWQGLPTVKQQLAFHIMLRGWFGGRAQLYKASDGTTRVDITPFDPMHTFYGMGRGGLAWACHKVLRTRDELRDQYGVPDDDVKLASEEGLGGSEETGIPVYDFYDRGMNYVVVGKEFVKGPEAHGASRVPVFLGMVGAAPFIQRKDERDIKELLAEVGESVYAANRSVYDAINKTVSDRMTLVRRNLEPGYVLESETGTKTLDANPYIERSEVPLKRGEKLTPLQLQEMTRDTDLLLGHLSGEMQRGALPHTAYGELQFQLSGFAINTLRQGLDLRIAPGVLALKAAYSQIAALLCEQYISGAYMPVTASGGIGRTYYKEMVEPEFVAQAGDLDIEIVPRLPKDDVSMYSMAQIAREGKTPLLSHRTTLDSVLKLEDADAEIKVIREEMAEMASPIAALTTLIQTAVDRGRMDLAAIYFTERQQLLMGMGQPPQAAPGAGPAPPGLPTTAAGPPQMTGFPQAPPTPPEVFQMNHYGRS